MRWTERRRWAPVLSVGVLVAGVAAWWVATRALSIPPYLLPTPEAVATRLLASPGLYAHHALSTLLKTLLGGGLGMAVGFSFGLAVAHVAPFRRVVFPYLIALRVLPTVAVAPVLLLYLGVGFDTAVLFVALVAFFPMAVSTAAGFDRVPPRHRDLLRSVGAGRVRSLLAVGLRFALPDLVAGAKQSAVLAVVGAVVAEWVVGTSGLGYLVLVSSETVQVASMLAAVAVLVCLGVGLYGAVALVGRRLVWTG